MRRPLIGVLVGGLIAGTCDIINYTSAVLARGFASRATRFGLPIALAVRHFSIPRKAS
jgi:hypothetical protein